MTHPTLGYANLRFASDDAVHMPATPTATMTVACDAGNGPLAGEQPFPYDVDAAVTCPNCLHALESDWWMAFMENERRTGEVSSLSGTLDDVRDAMGRLLSQADAVAEETMLGGGASMVSPIVVDISSDYLFAQDKVSFRARQGDAKAYEHVQNPITPEKLDDVVESLAQQLADQRSSPLVPKHEPKVARLGPFTGDVPLADPGAERVRRMMELSADGMSTSLTDSVHAAIDAAQQSLAEHPFDERCHRCNYDTHRCPGCGEPLPHGTEVCADCNVRLAYEVEFTHGGEVVDRSEHDYPDRNWCHVHNREAQAGREQCSECDGEQGEDRKAGES